MVVKSAPPISISSYGLIPDFRHLQGNSNSGNLNLQQVKHVYWVCIKSNHQRGVFLQISIY